MKTLWIALGLIALCEGISGCAYVTSSNPGMSVASGESWYTKRKFFLFIPLGTDIYYCPQPGSPCYKAQVD